MSKEDSIVYSPEDEQISRLKQTIQYYRIIVIVNISIIICLIGLLW